MRSDIPYVHAPPPRPRWPTGRPGPGLRRWGAPVNRGVGAGTRRALARERAEAAFRASLYAALDKRTAI